MLIANRASAADNCTFISVSENTGRIVSSNKPADISWRIVGRGDFRPIAFSDS